MKVRVNSDVREIPDGTTVQDLMGMLRVGRGPVAVELNREIVPKSSYAERRLSDGDQLEIVTFVGGG